MSYLLNIQNFQSISSLSLPIKGFTALVGKSNRGKSAILRSIRAILLNEWNAGFIKNGEKETQISFEIVEKTPYLLSIFPTLNIKKIILVKPSNEYQIFLEDGKILKYPKVGKNVPEKFEELNLSEIVTEREDSFNLNFQGQLDPLFLITSTEIEITSFINKVFDISRFEKALREMKTDNIKINRDLLDNENSVKVLEEEKKQTNKELEILSQKIVNIEKQLDVVERIAETHANISQGIETLRGLLEKKVILEQDRIRLEVQKIVENVGTCMEVSTKALISFLKEREQLLTQRKEVSSLEQGLSSKKAILSWYALGESCCSQVKEIMHVLQKTAELEKIKLIPEVLTSFTKEVNSYCILGDSYVGVAVETNFLNNARSKIVAEESLLRTNCIKKDALDLLKENIMGEIKICPVCERVICKGNEHK